MNKINSFSLSDEVVRAIEQTPKGERSNFVADAILQLDKDQRLAIIKNIKSFSRFHSEDKKSVVDVLRDIRDQAK